MTALFFFLFLVLKLAMISARGSRHGILWSHKLSQHSNMTQRLSSRYPLLVLFLLISDLVAFYRHAESCQLVIFVNSYFYRRILSTRGELPVCGIHNQSNSSLLSFRDGYHFKEFNHGSIQSFII